jgi:tetratricopeptide (TPR) repeat protein
MLPASGQIPPPSTPETQHVTVDESKLAAAAQKRPHDGSIWFNLGVVRAQRGEIATALSAFQHSISLLSDKRPAYRNIIALELTANAPAAALPPCRKALALDPADIDLLRNCSYALSHESKFAEAVNLLQTLKHAQPNDVAVRVALISALRGAGQTANSSVELKALFVDSLLSRGQAEVLAQDLSRASDGTNAEATYAYIIATWPPSAGPQRAIVPASDASTQLSRTQLSITISQATTMIRTERYVDAEHFLDQARAKYPNQPELEYDAALADVCLQRLSEAISILSRLKQQGTPSARVDFLLGGSYEIQGDQARAESSYREATALEPNNFAYYRVLAALLQKEGRFPESAALLQRALTLQPDDSQTLVLFARALERQGDITQAVSALEHSVRSDPESRRAHAALSALYFRQKRTAEAEQQQAVAARLEDQTIQKWNIWGTAPDQTNSGETN